MQRVQNNLARTALHSGSYNSLPDLRELHWLPICEACERIRYKIANLCYRAARVGQLLYLAELVADYRPVCVLRSADSHLLTETRSKPVIANILVVCRTSYLEFTPSSCSHCFINWQFPTTTQISPFQYKSHLFSIVFDAHT